MGAMSERSDFVGRLIGAASQGPVGAVLAASLSAVTQPFVNILVKQTPVEAVRALNLDHLRVQGELLQTALAMPAKFIRSTSMGAIIVAVAMATPQAKKFLQKIPIRYLLIFLFALQQSRHEAATLAFDDSWTGCASYENPHTNLLVENLVENFDEVCWFDEVWWFSCQEMMKKQKLQIEGGKSIFGTSCSAQIILRGEFHRCSLFLLFCVLPIASLIDHYC